MENGVTELYISRSGTEKRLGGLKRAGMLSPKREVIDITPLDSAERRFAAGRIECGILRAECLLPEKELIGELMGDLFSGEALGLRLVLANGASFAFTALASSVSAGCGRTDGAPELAVEFVISGGIEIIDTEE